MWNVTSPHLYPIIYDFKRFYANELIDLLFQWLNLQEYFFPLWKLYVLYFLQSWPTLLIIIISYFMKLNDIDDGDRCNIVDNVWEKKNIDTFYSIKESLGGNRLVYNLHNILSTIFYLSTPSIESVHV